MPAHSTHQAPPLLHLPLPADYLELKSTLTGPGLDPRFVGNGTVQYRKSLRVWQLPQFTLAGEFVTGVHVLRLMAAAG
jgi:hypothetical protein